MDRSKRMSAGNISKRYEALQGRSTRILTRKT